MKRAGVPILLLSLASAASASTLVSPALASQMRQSPAMMRRAGPSCSPGHLGGSRYAGYNYLLGPCRGVDATAPQYGRAVSR